MKKRNVNVFDMVTPITNQDVVLAQGGDEAAWERIVSFLKPRAKAHAYLLYPAKASSLQDCDMQSAFFGAVENAVMSFKEGNKRFESYYLTVYQHELCRIFKETDSPEQVIIVSLDNTVKDSDDTLVFADCLADRREEDKTYLDVEYAAQLYNKTTKNLDDELAVKVADLRRKNKTFQEIAEELGISQRIAYQKFQKYVSAMKRAFKNM